MTGGTVAAPNAFHRVWVAAHKPINLKRESAAEIRIKAIGGLRVLLGKLGKEKTRALLDELKQNNEKMNADIYAKRSDDIAVIKIEKEYDKKAKAIINKHIIGDSAKKVFWTCMKVFVTPTVIYTAWVGGLPESIIFYDVLSAIAGAVTGGAGAGMVKLAHEGERRNATNVWKSMKKEG